MPPSPSEADHRARWSWILLLAAICLLLVAYFTLPLDVFGPARPVLSWTSLAVALAVLSLLLLREIQRLLLEGHHGHPALGILLLVCLSLVIFASAYDALALIVLSLLLLREIRKVVVQAQQGHPATNILVLICLSLVIFASGYYAMSHHPGEFNGLHTRLDALYFTVITVSTVGFGDISPAGQAARAVVVVQIVYNFVFLAAAVSALSSRVRGRVADRAQSRRDGPGSGGGRAGRGKSGRGKTGRG